MIKATIFLHGPCSLFWTLLDKDARASKLYDKLHGDKLVVSTTAMVRLDLLHCTQSHVDPEAIADYVAQPRQLSVDRHHCVSDLPIVAKYKGWYFALDGHHRLISKKVQGFQRAKAYLWDFDALLGRA